MIQTNQAVGTAFLSKESGRMLLSYRTNLKSFPHHWCLWSGKIEEGESPIYALLRECNEELAITVPPHMLHPWDIYTNSHNNFTFYTFVSVVQDEFSPKLNDESHGYGWFKYDALPRPLHPGIKKSFMGWKARQRLEAMIKS